MRKILGIDPGTQITGVGVVAHRANTLKPIYSESIKLGNKPLSQRLFDLYARLNQIVQTLQPDTVAIEKVFLAKNPQSALVLGHARGVAMLAAVNNAVPIVEYSATEIKKTVVGRGRADKVQVQHMVAALLGLDAPPENDAADALAAAICHAHQGAYQALHRCNL